MPMDPKLLSDKKIEGWAIRYGDLSLPIVLPSGRRVFERFLPGAFAGSVAEINGGNSRVKLNVEHDKGALLQLAISGPDGNLVLEHRTEGVYLRAQLLNETTSGDLWTKVAARLVGGLSIEFGALPGIEPQYETYGGGDYLRTFSLAELRGIAVTAAGLYPGSTLTVAGAPDSQPALQLRSLDAADAAALAAEIAAWEETQRRHYEAFALGIR